jgi:hypothetical protein
VYGALMQQGQFRHFWKFARPEIHVDNMNIPFSYISEKAQLLHCRAQYMKAANLITEFALRDWISKYPDFFIQKIFPGWELMLLLQVKQTTATLYYACYYQSNVIKINVRKKYKTCFMLVVTFSE